MNAKSTFLEFITKPGCHLCDDALPLVRTAANRAGLGVVERSVLDDEQLMIDYGLRIPVVLLDGDVIAEGIVGPEDLEGLAG